MREYNGKQIEKIYSANDVYGNKILKIFYEDGTMEIIQKTTVKVNLENGDYFITKINCTPEEACKYYKIGSWVNMGDEYDDLQKVKSLEFIYN